MKVGLTFWLTWWVSAFYFEVSWKAAATIFVIMGVAALLAYFAGVKDSV